jgi:hypothetical protein
VTVVEIEYPAGDLGSGSVRLLIVLDVTFSYLYIIYYNSEDNFNVSGYLNNRYRSYRWKFYRARNYLGDLLGGLLAGILGRDGDGWTWSDIGRSGEHWLGLAA